MSSRRAVLAAGAALSLTAAARLCVADVAIDSWRAVEAPAAWRCPERIAKAAGDMVARAGGARFVTAELIGGRARTGFMRTSAGTLDLDVLKGGHPRPAFRLRFPAQRQVSQFMLALFMNDGSSRAACVVQLPKRETAFEMEFPLTDFRQALGVADFGDVDYILLVARRAAGAGDADQAADGQVIAISVSGAHRTGALVARCR